MLKTFADGLDDNRTGAAAGARVFDPAEFERTYLRILDKRQQVIPFVRNRVQAHFMAHRTGRDIVLKARQHGFSTMLQADAFMRCVTGTAMVLTLAHDTESTQRLRRMFGRFYDHFPEPKPRLGNDSTTLTTFPETGSEATIATAGNVHSGRAGTYSDLHLSEAAFYKDLRAILSGALQGGDPRATLESSPNGATGYFYQLCMEARDGRNDWALHFYPWWWSDDYALALEPGETLDYTDDESALIAQHSLSAEQIKWRRIKQRELRQTFVQEYPEDPVTCFLKSGFGYFGDLSGLQYAPAMPVYDPTHRYVAGLDFAQTVDYCALSVLDCGTLNEVARLRINNLPWSELRSRVRAVLKAWRVAYLLAEKNSMGSTNIEALRSEIASDDDKLWTDRTRIEAFETTNESKALIMSGLHEALHGNHLRLQSDPDWNYELGAFVATQLPSGVWRLAAKEEGDHDDTVIARALAYHAIYTYRPYGGIWIP